MSKEVWKVVGSFAAGLVVGAATGYFVSKKSAEIYYAEMAAQDIHDVKEHYRLLRKEDVDLEEIGNEMNTKSSDLESLQKILDENGYSVSAEDVTRMMTNPAVDIEAFFKNLGINIPEEVEDETVVEESVTNVFDIPEEDPGVEDEESEDPEYLESVANRTPEEPYVLHLSEYMDPDNTNEKYTITYYQGDDTLVDEANRVIPDVERLVGEDSLTMFGKFSNDNEIVYVRNERESVDFEIIRNESSYVDTILGTVKQPILEMRGDD